MIGYIGSITGDPASGDVGPGIAVLDIDTASGELRLVQKLHGFASPTYLALHPTLPVLYAGERAWPPMGPSSPGTGSIATLAIDPSTGQLTERGRQPCGGPTHLTVHPSGRYIVAAMNRIHTVGVFPLGSDGSVGAPSAQVVHEGRGPISPNQDSAFPHSCWFDHAATRILCCDLALDRIMLYDLDLESGALRPAPQPSAQVSSGAGPRHLALHPQLDVVYLLNELDSTISVFQYTPTSGQMAILQTISTLPERFDAPSAAAQIMVHPSGGAVYASNRGHDSIAVFAVDLPSGRLRHSQHVPAGGQRPHNFTLDRGGSFMLVANQRSGSVNSFQVDPASGELAATGHTLALSAPVCAVLFER